MSDTALNDDYIIALLKRDAEANRRQSSLGASAYLSTAKRRPDAPKPNTRFLKNLVRDADSHNAALKAKEEADAKTRMEKLKRQREGDESEARDAKKRREGERKGRWASAFGGLGAVSGKREDELHIRGRAGKERVSDSKDDGARMSHRERRHRSRSRDGERRRRRRSVDQENDGGDRIRLRSRSRDRNGKHHRQRTDDYSRRETSRSRSKSRERHQQRKHSRRDRSTSPEKTARSRRHDRADPEEVEDDPLTSFLGPQPPPQPIPRGRGAYKSSTIDSRFASSYDPTTDVQPEHDEAERDDWDLALEALRDRAKYQSTQADRLRAAGFTEEEVRRWEDGGRERERGVEDVRWRKVGEGRDWDRGKVLLGEGGGGVRVKAGWVEEGRLKGT